MNVTVVGFSAKDLLVSCVDSLKKFILKGFNVNLIFIKNKTNQIELKFLEKICEKIGLINIEYLEDFDFSTTTQKNVKSLRDLIIKNNPNLVLIPFNDSNNIRKRIVGTSTILASRELKNIIMYESEPNENFYPNLYSKIQKGNSVKQVFLKQLNNNKNGKNTNMKLKIISNAEQFQSFRIILENDFLLNED